MLLLQLMMMTVTAIAAYYSRHHHNYSPHDYDEISADGCYDNHPHPFRFVSVECVERLDSLCRAMQRRSQAAVQTTPGLSSRTPL